MLKFPAALRSRNALVSVLGIVLIAGTTTVVAQTTPLEPVQWDKRRLEQLDRNVRRLERAVTQRNAAGVVTAGFGRVNPASTSSPVSNGQAVASLQF